METRRPPTIDMTPDGNFRQPVRPSFSGRLILAAIGIAVVTGAAALAALALWFALALIPIAAVAALVGYLTIRYRMWRNRRDGLFRGQRDIARP